MELIKIKELVNLLLTESTVYPSNNLLSYRPIYKSKIVNILAVIWKNLPEHQELVKRVSAEINKDYSNFTISDVSEVLNHIINIIDIEIKREEIISKSKYQELIKERDSLKKINEYLVKYKGLLELNEILEQSKNIGIPTDEYWVLAICSLNLIEATVNKKLETLKEKIDGNFKDKYNRLCEAIKKNEHRDISKILPLALYDNIRNKLDHASDVNKVTPNEAKQINDIVKQLMQEFFPHIK